MDDIGGNLRQETRSLLNTKGRPQIVLDNFGFKVLANIILTNQRNSDMHWMAHFITFDRIPPDHLNDSKPLVSDIKTFENKEYLLDKRELKNMKSDFSILVSRVLVQFFPCLQYVKNEVVQHISHK